MGQTYRKRNSNPNPPVPVQELVEAYAAEAKATGKPQLMLTAAVSAGKGTIDAGYEIAEIAKYCFFLDSHV